MVSKDPAAGLPPEPPVETGFSVCTPLPCLRPDRSPAFVKEVPFDRAPGKELSKSELPPTTAAKHRMSAFACTLSLRQSRAPDNSESWG